MGAIVRGGGVYGIRDVVREEKRRPGCLEKTVDSK